MKTYLALTIGPIYKTIERARKTRELWAASFLLSLFMKRLLQNLQPYGVALSPDTTHLNDDTRYHGAGIWNDNCFFALHDDKIQELKKQLPEIIRSVKREVVQLALLDLEKDKKRLPLQEEALSALLERHFHCHAVLHTPKEEAEEIMKVLGDKTASAEMQDRFPERNDNLVAEAIFRGYAVRGLYSLGYDDNDPVFTYYKSRFDGFESNRRLPSLLEIAVREFKRDAGKYGRIVQIINERIQGKDDDADTDEENQAIIEALKKEKDNKGNSVFKKRHKYVAIVQSDGDGVGTMIQKKKDPEIIRGLSKALMAFSTEAVDQIAGFDALPVYAGGDDLLFIAPLRNKEGQTIFDLIKTLQATFARQTLLKEEGASLSFGVSIFYYKYPLGEALENGRHLLNGLAKKLAYHSSGEASTLKKKKALAFRVMLHAGQSFATVLRQEGKVWDQWNALLHTHDAVQTDTAFVSGVIHTLEKLEWLLSEACAHKTTEYFFDHHFNEAKGTPHWAFIQSVRQLAECIYDEYHTLMVEEESFDAFVKAQLDVPADGRYPNDNFDAATLRNKYCNNLLYSALRVIQFLNAEDHE
jgi:CRISPR-associated protein Cmr2